MVHRSPERIRIPTGMASFKLFKRWSSSKDGVVAVRISSSSKSKSNSKHIIVGCRRHPKHIQSPGVCSICLREKLSHLSCPSSSSSSSRAIHNYYDSSSSSSSLSSYYSSCSSASSCSSPVEERRRFAYYGGQGMSLRSLFGIGGRKKKNNNDDTRDDQLSKSRSLTFGKRNQKEERDSR